MKKDGHPVSDHLKLLAFILFLSELVLFFTALLFGHAFGYMLTLTASFWLGMILAGCFALIVMGDIARILLLRLCLKTKAKDTA